MDLTHLRSKLLGLAVAGSVILISSSTVRASNILGAGESPNDFLLGGDLTDPENDGQADADVGYNAIFSADQEEGFGGGEFAFNVFDNLTGGGQNKWCCGNTPGGFPHFIQAEFAEPYALTHFTVTSGNDTDGRDPRVWRIEGSNDGTNFTTIFERTDSATSPWNARNQTILWHDGSHPDGGAQDFPVQTTAYTHFRMTIDATGMVGGADFQFSELELFGTAQVVPEPSAIALALLGVVGAAFVGWRRRRKH